MITVCKEAHDFIFIQFRWNVNSFIHHLILNFTSFVCNHSRLGIAQTKFVSALGLTVYFF